MLRSTLAASLCVLGLLAVAAVCFAQEPSAPPEPGGQDDGLGMRERMLQGMLTSRLKLDEAQQAKLKEILKSTKKDTDDKIKAMLTDEQKKGYDDMQREGGRGFGMGGFGGERGGRGGRGGFGGGPGGPGGPGGGFGMGPGGFGMGGFGQGLEEMKKRLNLTDGQYDKVQEIISEIGEEVSSKVLEKLPQYMENGRPDWRRMLREMSSDMDTYMNKAADKIRKVLKEEQLPEFEKMFEELKTQIKGMGERAEQGPGGPDAGGRGEGRGNRLERIMEELSGSAEEKAILREKIKAILDCEERWRGEIRKIRNEMSEALRDGKAPTEDLQAKLNAMRDLQKKSEAEIKVLRDDLVPLLSFEQEARLVIRGVLE